MVSLTIMSETKKAEEKLKNDSKLPETTTQVPDKEQKSSSDEVVKPNSSSKYIKSKERSELNKEDNDTKLKSTFEKNFTVCKKVANTKFDIKSKQVMCEEDCTRFLRMLDGLKDILNKCVAILSCTVSYTVKTRGCIRLKRNAHQLSSITLHILNSYI